MSTRGCIAMIKDIKAGTFKGRYHHWDSYPSGLGAFLYRAYHEQFACDIEAMLTRLINDCKCGGWSTVVGADLSLPDNSVETDYSKGDDMPSYSARSFANEDDHWVDEKNASGSGVEYVYAFDGTTMYILSSYNEDGSKMIGMFGMGNANATWECIAAIDLDGREPDWAGLGPLQLSGGSMNED